MTRIVSGLAKGRSLKVPPKGTRPTSERVREALFSRLDHSGILEDAEVLDLYAGTGALALEALSRGARSADLVEKSRGASRSIRMNIQSTGLDARLHTHDVQAFLAGRSGEVFSGQFDVVFIDPPYDIDEETLARNLAALGPWISPDAVILVERDIRSPEPMWPEFLEREDRRSWGETVVWFAGAV